ncbi:MAG: signal peptidase I [Phycisphaera sp.]|nr:signal peptidase I [Phycisphaera sp.]
MFMIVYLAIIVAVIAGLWKTFAKAGQPGWGAIIPIYNVYLLTQIAGRPWWWLLLFFIPIVNLVITILLALDIAKAFGKTPVFGIVALWLFAPVGYCMLGFGSATYQGAPNSQA